ncbi:MAG: Coenzyme F420 hydrogenase/dehydrogenase, beta subunit C-terminal domain [Hylemonella sp.]|uniref:Coenzyme F420 hydrogenase/dehydrogenase, beta subunit C-terminal domain n=1 Tax=Hylemonella sp. TaxID=2066020 RepID=UPI0022C05ABC|nr:Coenzyme F420 hydrogenase/dehydrogenase, beta subunit C-terminal domain [Hylemonella sp.]MCZ8253833.1 Coenzyme F420 hydrogenase/dehydrogenase, beta subunit C-terminal domain [Hylemonella sp.]
MNTSAPHRRLCTDCGISRTAEPQRCGSACQFIQPDYPALERRVQGRARGEGPAASEDELFFGPYQGLLSARLRQPLAGAQWTGVTTRIAERLLEQGRVDAVIAMAPHPEDRWRPMPVIVTRAEDMARCRGMRMGYAPLLELVEPALAQGHKRLAVIGIPCQVYALRAIQPQLEREQGLESLYVIGTPCSDNTTTENFHHFLGLLSDQPQDIAYLEFRADYKVEIRTDQGEHRLIPFLNLPLSRLKPDFFPLTCRTCVDYTNVLADITVGYMGGNGQQWLLVRNQRGQQLLDGLGEEVQTSAPTSRGRREGAVHGFMANTERAAGGLPLRRMPAWLRPLVNWLMPRVGPRGLEFARARVEMKAIETVLHLRREAPAKMKNMVPAHVWQLVQRYGLKPGKAEDSD